MKKDKCASCGCGGKLKADEHHSPSTDCTYRVMFCEACFEEGTGYLKNTPVYCPACGKKFDETDLHYLSDLDEWDYEAAALLAVTRDSHDWDSRFSFAYSYLDCPHCAYYVAHGQRWYFNEETNTYDLPQPAGAPMPAAEEREIAMAAGQIEIPGFEVGGPVGDGHYSMKVGKITISVEQV